MTIKLNSDQYQSLIQNLIKAEVHSLHGVNGQVWIDVRTNEIWTTTMPVGTHYDDTEESKSYLQIWGTEPHTLKDYYGDEPDYEDWKWYRGEPTDPIQCSELENWHLSGESDMFHIDSIISDIMEKHDIATDF